MSLQTSPLNNNGLTEEIRSARPMFLFHTAVVRFSKLPENFLILP